MFPAVRVYDLPVVVFVPFKIHVVAGKLFGLGDRRLVCELAAVQEDVPLTKL